MLSDWPVADAALDFPEEEKAMELIMDAIRGVRTRRSEMNVPPSKKAHLTVATGEQDIFVLGVPFLKKLAYASEVTLAQPGTAPGGGLRHRGHPCGPDLHASGGAGGPGEGEGPHGEGAEKRTATSSRS